MTADRYVTAEMVTAAHAKALELSGKLTRSGVQQVVQASIAAAPPVGEEVVERVARVVCSRMGLCPRRNGCDDFTCCQAAQDTARAILDTLTGE